MKPEVPHFQVGDIIIDTLNGEIGVLLRRYNLYDADADLIDLEIYGHIMVWDIYWTGTKLYLFADGIQTYTEEGLVILLQSGVLAHYHNI